MSSAAMELNLNAVLPELVMVVAAAVAALVDILNRGRAFRDRPFLPGGAGRCRRDRRRVDLAAGRAGLHLPRHAHHRRPLPWRSTW